MVNFYRNCALVKLVIVGLLLFYSCCPAIRMEGDYRLFNVQPVLLDAEGTDIYEEVADCVGVESDPEEINVYFVDFIKDKADGSEPRGLYKGGKIFLKQNAPISTFRHEIIHHLLYSKGVEENHHEHYAFKCVY